MKGWHKRLCPLYEVAPHECGHDENACTCGHCGGEVTIPADAPRLTAPRLRVLEWMSKGDRMLHKCAYDSSLYGFHRRVRDQLRFEVVTRRTMIIILIATGLVEWQDDCPNDLRAGLSIAGFRFFHKEPPEIMIRQAAHRAAQAQKGASP